jgi:hypothetical protein
MMWRMMLLAFLVTSLPTASADAFFVYWSPTQSVMSPLLTAWKEEAWEEDVPTYEAVQVTKYQKVCHGDHCTWEPYTVTEWRRVK